MKYLIVFSLLLFSDFSNSQTVLNDDQSEQIANFTALLVDYEIHNDKLVALVKSDGEFFIYFQDSSGTGLFESIEVNLPKDLKLDDRGYLFIEGFDSTFQLSISDHVEIVDAMHVDSYYRSEVFSTVHFETTKAILNQNMVEFYRTDQGVDSSTIPIAQFSINAQTAVVTSKRPRVSSSRNKQYLDQPLEYDVKTDVRNDIVRTSNYKTGKGHEWGNDQYSLQVSNGLNGFKKDGNLWLIDEVEYGQVVLDEFGTYLYRNLITPCPYNSTFLQDDSNGNVYVLTKSGSSTQIDYLDEAGKLVPFADFKKGLSKSDLKISNGYLYFRDSAGKGESIERIKLD